MNAAPPTSTEIDALIRLLDDDTPMVRERVTERLAATGGDLSTWFASHPRSLSREEGELLAEILRVPKRNQLLSSWSVPTDAEGVPMLGWPEVEALLASLSEFLHDGISSRTPMVAALDGLAAAATVAGVKDAMALRKFLFVTGGFRGNKENYHDPRNSDLAWAIAERLSNPIGLCLIFILVGRRLGMPIEGVGFPGHFLCRIFQEGYPIIIDCFDGGQIHLQDSLLEPESDLTRQQRVLLRKSVPPGAILVRVLNNLAASFQTLDRDEDSHLVQHLRSLLEG